MKFRTDFHQTSRPQARPGSLSRVSAEWHCDIRAGAENLTKKGNGEWGTEKWETNKGNVDIPIGLNELLYVGNTPGSLLADETVLSRNARSRRNGMMPM